MTTTFDEHLDVVQNALKHEWAKDHIRELRKLHHTAEANDELVSERELRVAAQQREQDAKVALAIVERMLASERAAHAATAAAYEQEADAHAETQAAHAAATADAEKHRERAEMLAADLADAHLELPQLHNEITALTRRLNAAERNLSGLRGLPRQYGHLDDCGCDPCTYAREVTAR